MLFAVDDDSRYLLVHEDEDGAEKRRDRRSQHRPPGVATYRVDQPASVVSGGLIFESIKVSQSLKFMTISTMSSA